MLRTRRHPPRRGFTLIEAALSLVVVSAIVIGSLEAASAMARAQRSLHERQFAARAADAHLSRLLSQSFPDPSIELEAQPTPVLVGSTLVPLLTNTLSTVLTEPLTSATGTALTSQSGWTRSVTITQIDPANPALTVTGTTNLRRITVTVSKDGRALATRSSLRTYD